MSLTISCLFYIQSLLLLLLLLLLFIIYYLFIYLFKVDDTAKILHAQKIYIKLSSTRI